MEFTNTYRNVRTSSAYVVEDLVAESTANGFRAALVRVQTKDAKGNGYTKFVLRIDVSKYRPAFNRLRFATFRTTNSSDVRIMHNLNVVRIPDLGKDVFFYECNLSPSLWDNGFRISTYLEGVVYVQPKTKMESMKHVLRHGFNEDNIAEFADSIARDAASGLKKLFDWLDNSGIKTLKPDGDF